MNVNTDNKALDTQQNQLNIKKRKNHTHKIRIVNLVDSIAIQEDYTYRFSYRNFLWKNYVFFGRIAWKCNSLEVLILKLSQTAKNTLSGKSFWIF